MLVGDRGTAPADLANIPSAILSLMHPGSGANKQRVSILTPTILSRPNAPATHLGLSGEGSAHCADASASARFRIGIVTALCPHRPGLAYRRQSDTDLATDR